MSPISRPVGVDIPEVIPTRPIIDDGEKPTSGDKDDNEDGYDEEDAPDWWHGFVDKINQFKDWATGLFEGKKEGDGTQAEDSRVN